MSLERAGMASGALGGGSDGAALPLEIKQPNTVLPPEKWVWMGVLLCSGSALTLSFVFDRHRTFHFMVIVNSIIVIINSLNIFRAQRGLQRHTILSNEGISRNFGFAGVIPWSSLSACEFRKFWGLQRLRFYVLPDAYNHITMTLRSWTFFQSERLRNGHFNVYFELKFPKQNAESIAALCAAKIAEARAAKVVGAAS